MDKQLISKESLAANLRSLMDNEELSEAKTAKKTKVSQRAINKVLNQEGAATVDTLDRLSEGFKQQGWKLILPKLPPELLFSADLEQLIESFIKSSPDGREHILRTAEREAEYTKK